MKNDWHKKIKKLVNNDQLFPEMTVNEFIDRVKYEAFYIGDFGGKHEQVSVADGIRPVWYYISETNGLVSIYDYNFLSTDQKNKCKPVYFNVNNI